MDSNFNSLYDSNYYNNGVATGKSCYENYRWIPELTYPLAFSILRHLGLENCKSVLDYGCAHGFIVKALNGFGIDAYGVDVSEYAISAAPQDIQDRLFKIGNTQSVSSVVNEYIDVKYFDYVIAKDVFEHIRPSDLEKLLVELSGLAKNLFVVVPLGDQGRYRIAAYHRDITHIVAENENWWTDIFKKNGWLVEEFLHEVRGIKENWTKANQTGNGFFKLKSIQN